MKKSFSTHTRGAKALPGLFLSRRNARVPLPAVALVLLLPHLLLASDEPVEVIEVTASRVEEAQRRAVTGFATSINPEVHAEQMETVTDALAESVGVQVRRFGGLGAFSTMSIRGSSANQVQVYLDGIPLSRARNETVNLADLPLDNLERIDVYRGTAPISFGTAAIGGVVNLVTKPPSTEPTSELSASYGSFDTRKVTASHSLETHGFGLLGFVTYLGSEGDFSFETDNGTPENPTDDYRTKRRENGFDSVEGLFKGNYSFANHLQIDLTSEIFFKEQDLAGAGHLNDLPQSASLRDLRSLNYLRAAQTDLLAGELDVTGTLFGIYDRVVFNDRHNRLGGGNQARRDTTTVIGGNVTGTYAPAVNYALDWLAEISHESLAPFSEIPEPTNYPDQRRWHAALGLQPEAAFLEDRLLLSPSVRYENIRDSFTETDNFGRLVPPRHTQHLDLWSPAMGISFRPLSWLLVKANIAREERAPNFSELFGQTGSVTGDNDLEPETAINRDVGLVVDYGSWRWLDRLRLEYAYFNNDIDDLIVLRRTGGGRYKPLNVNGARVRGHEVALATTWLGHVGLDANYTYQDTENMDPEYRGNKLPQRPRDEFYTRAMVFGGPGKLYYEFNFVAGNFLDPVNYDETPSRDIHTVGLSLTPRSWLKLSFEARNLTDNQVTDVGNFPLPGRSFFGTVKLTL